MLIYRLGLEIAEIPVFNHPAASVEETLGISKDSKF